MSLSGLVDTHCHIHAARSDRADFTAQKWHQAGETAGNALLKSAHAAGVEKLLCVGTDLSDSKDAVDFVQDKDSCWASVGVHPHEAKVFLAENKDLAGLAELLENPKVVAIGEVGLDYYYEHSPKAEQIRLLEMFLQLATDKKLPIIFHIREAFSDFWPILSHFEGVRGVLHSYTADIPTLDKALQKGLYIGLNGIMTFTREEAQLEMAKKVPLRSLVLETDAPYLAPKPYRGKVNKPAYVKEIAEFLAELRSEDLEQFADQTTKNARRLFNL